MIGSLFRNLKQLLVETIYRIRGNCFYVLEGICSANTHFIENKAESDQFLKFVGRYLSHYVKVYDFSITKKGWILVIRTKCDSTIEKQYAKRQKQKNNSKVTKEMSVWNIVSDAIRLMRSHFTRWTNRRRERQGNSSLRVYRRYLFEDYEEASKYVERIRNQEIEMEQSNNRYRANSDHFDEDGHIRANQGCLASPFYRRRRRDGSQLGIKFLQIEEYLNRKLELLIRRTCAVHGITFECVEKGMDKLK